jgi:hypothetical protein
MAQAILAILLANAMAATVHDRKAVHSGSVTAARHAGLSLS